MKWKHVYPFLFFFQKLWSDINKYAIPNKVKETQFKIINRYYPCNDFLFIYLFSMTDTTECDTG